jgi:glutamate-1-semialdehyde 2,1-aminomutase
MTVNFQRSKELQARLQHIIPGGAHTYAKGANQYPELSPGVIARGAGCHVWDVDGNEFIEYGMGLRAVTLGHAYPPVVEAVRAALELGTNFTRPAAIELDCAERFLDIIQGAEMVKFTKDGSTADTAALRLARAHTGRQKVALCAEHPFFSYDDWFMCTTTTDGGTSEHERKDILGFSYNDIASLERLFEQYPGQIAAVFMEPARTEEPGPGFLESVRKLTRDNGTVLVFDEMITGFRWDLGGAQKLYGVKPDLSAFGKALANGFSVSALCGDRDIMRLGARDSEEENVFLLSTTHGAEVPSLAAAVRTMEIYQSEAVVEYLYRQGDRLAAGVREVIARRGLGDHVGVLGRPVNLLYWTRDQDKKPSQEFRTLFLQETIRRGVLMPSLVVSYSHSDEDVDRTVDAIDGALEVYAKALEDGVGKYLIGPASQHVFDRRWPVA